MAYLRDDYRTSYPSLDTFLSRTLPELVHDRTVIAAVRHWGDMTDGGARQTLADPSAPPAVVPVEPEILPNGVAFRGRFDPQNPDQILIARDICNRFESNPEEPRIGTLIEAVVLHEIAHWGFYRANGYNERERERGELLERQIYGSPRYRFGRRRGPGLMVIDSDEEASDSSRHISSSTAAVAKAIVNIFETGTPQGDYSRVTRIPGDTGGLTYGRSQTTLNSGGLQKLLSRYFTEQGAVLSDELATFSSRVKSKDDSLAEDRYFCNLLRAAADDPAMVSAQTAFFDEQYWEPAFDEFKSMSFEYPLSLTVIYDSFIHGSWRYMKRKTNERIGSATSASEKQWIERYVATRKTWLSGHRRRDLRATSYRMHALENLISAGLWELPLPLVVRGVELSEQSINADSAGSFAGPDVGSRTLRVRSPLMSGSDVRRLQLALSSPNWKIDVIADGLYGPATEAAVQQFQSIEDLTASGQCGMKEFEHLGLLNRRASPV